MVLGTYEGENDNVYGYRSDEDALDKAVIRHVFRATRSLNLRAEVFTTNYQTRETGQNDSIVERGIPTSFDLSRR